MASGDGLLEEGECMPAPGEPVDEKTVGEQVRTEPLAAARALGATHRP